MKEAANDFPNLVSSLNHRSEQMPIEEYVQSTWQKIGDAQYNMVELVDLAWGEENYLGLDFA